MNTPLAARWASFSRSFSRSNCIGHYLTRMPSVASSFKCDVSREMNYLPQAATLHSKFLKYPTGLEKQPIHLLIFPISQGVRHGRSEDD